MTDGKKKLIGTCAKAVGYVGGVSLVSVGYAAYIAPIVEEHKIWKPLCYIGAVGAAYTLGTKIETAMEDFVIDCIELIEVGIDAVKDL